MRSTRSLLATAVDDIASAPPNASAPCQERPSSQAHNRIAAEVTKTCARPRPNTMRFMLMSRGSENSRPMVNIRKTTPNSAR